MPVAGRLGNAFLVRGEHELGFAGPRINCLLCWGLMRAVWILLPFGVLSVVLAYGSLHLVVAWLYPRQLFPYAEIDPEEREGQFFLESARGDRIATLYLPGPSPAAPLLLYSHGNGEDLLDGEERYAWWHELGYAVLAYDYPGYGTSSGRASAAGVKAAADAVLRHAREDLEYPRERILLWGRSLGGAPTLWMAREGLFLGVVLEATFRSVLSLAPSLPPLLFLPEPFPNDRWAREVRSPVLLVHGILDPIVPVEHAHRLREHFQAPLDFHLVENVLHGNVLDGVTPEVEAWLEARREAASPGTLSR